MSRRDLLTIIISIFSVAAIVTAIVVGSSRNDDLMNEEFEDSIFRLNDTLTNEMSNIPDLLAMDRKVNAYLRKWHMKGASLAITRGDSLVYAKGYGWADEENGLEMMFKLNPNYVPGDISESEFDHAASELENNSEETNKGVTANDEKE